jgi:DNA mismatch endonuclease (patch repair protein)
MTAGRNRTNGPERKKARTGGSLEAWLPVRTDAKTSMRMALVRQRDTTAELAARRALHALGHRFRVRNRDLPGSPDIANRRRHWAVFVHGCFWHRHQGCPRTTTPKRNRNFWSEKFQANQERDRRALTQLRRLGYKVVVVWECETECPEVLVRKLRKLYKSKKTNNLT